VTAIVWKDPPIKERSWEARLKPLLSEPGRWALVNESPTEATARTVTWRLNKRTYKVPQPDDLWEFEQRGREVYARFLGPQENATAVTVA
jgi:hypothetical protein